MYGWDGSVPFLSSTVPQLESDWIPSKFFVHEGKIISDRGWNFLCELLSHEGTDERSFPHWATANQAHFDELVDLFWIRVDHIK